MSPARFLRIALDTACDRIFLTDDALMDVVFHTGELVGLRLEHPGEGNAGPARDDLGDVLAW